jgi:hypothetical protein
MEAFYADSALQDMVKAGFKDVTDAHTSLSTQLDARI